MKRTTVHHPCSPPGCGQRSRGPLRIVLVTAPFFGAFAAPCLAQTTINSTNKFAWGENIGWTNWADAGGPLPSPTNNGAALVPLSAPVIMKGYVWGENVGWINLGNGTVGNVPYANTNGTNFGVNVSTSMATPGWLSGYAWGENIGWVNFSGGAQTTPQFPARYFVGSPVNRLKGYIWGENVGWINLDDLNHYVQGLCSSDFNADGFVSGEDFDGYIAAFEAGDSAADFNADGFVSGEDFDGFVAAFESGC